MENKAFDEARFNIWRKLTTALEAKPEFKTFMETCNVMYATPEYKAYRDADEEAEKEAEKAWTATPEYKNWRKAWNVLKFTPYYRAYELWLRALYG